MFADPCAMALSSFDLQFTVGAAACRGKGGERGAGPGHPRQGGIQRVKLQKFKCCNRWFCLL